MGVQGELGNGEDGHGESIKDISIDRADPGAQDPGDSAWNTPYGPLSNAGLRGSIESMHEAGDS